VVERVQTLAMPHAAMEITVGDDPPGDDVTFLIAVNPGLPLLPLSRVASGGELARTMLALRLVLTEAPETLVFDEVDAGIGGAAASAVGEALARLGKRHQVMVVTHLAQVAALADTHIMVTKSVDAGATTATAQSVDDDARVAEVARMLSGDRGGESARLHAAELLGDHLRLS
jgi:DNA repair protein RecN (Recombination protein N)